MYILPPSISKKIEGYRWQSFTPPAAGKSRRFRGLICHRRSHLLPVPTEPAFPAEKDTLDKLFAEDANYQFPLGQLLLNKTTPLKVHGDRFFSKHIAIVGSTGSGKSCTVALILQDVVGIADGANTNIKKQNNSHVVIFDIHDEYTAAFTLAEEQSFTLNRLDIDSLCLPYWLMNSEELESMFIESNEQNSHNQVSQFNSPVMKSLSDQSVSGATMMTSIAGLPSMFATMAIARAVSN